MGTGLGIRSQPAWILRSRIGAAPTLGVSAGRSWSTNLGATRRACGRLVMARRRSSEDEGREQELEEESWKRRIVRTLLIDNYDSYTYNVFQELSIVNDAPPVVIRNDEWTWEVAQYYLYEEQAFDNIVISPGPGSPACPADIGICLQILLDCKDIPILGVCLGHQALGFVHGAQIVHAPKPVHGRLSEIEHTGSPLFNDIPSGRNSGFQVVRYHSLVIDADSLPKELIPTAWTASAYTLPFLGTKKSDRIHDVLVNGTCQGQPLSRFHSYSKNAGFSRLSTNNLERTNVVMGIMHSTRPHYGVQFHPESVATHHGRKIFENFKRITVDHGLKSSMLHERKVSPGCMPFKGLAKSKLVNFKAAIGHRLDICSSSVLARKTGVAKHLKLQWKKIDCLLSQVAGPETIFCELFGDKSAKDTFWLDSASTDQGRARFSFMGGKGGSLWKQITFQLSGPSEMTSKVGGYLTIQDGFGPEKRMFLEDGFFDFLKKELQSFDYDKEDFEMLPFDFCGGFVGFIGYDLKVECGASSNRHTSKTPDACFFFADNLVVIDHWNGDIYILSLHDINCPDTTIELNGSLKGNSWLVETEKRLLRLRSMATGKLDVQQLDARSSIPCKESFIVEKSRPQYMKDVERCLKFIRDGESYELCLTTQMRKGVGNVDALKLYLNLRGQNPAPYAAWLNFSKENLFICCSSPERFLSLDRNGMLEAKPIKGTIARGRTPEEDKCLRLQLQYSEKDQAENLMIVDLLRNDLGRVCEPGSVCVPHLMQVESYATVHTLVSTIQGKRKPDISPVDCVRAAFPGGSMTGAPKLRSMELLDSLESCSRGVYSGSIGFFSYNQTFDLNIVIRTVVIHKGEASVGAGGAIVALSDPEDEYEEMMLKAKAPTKVVEQCTRELDYWGEYCR